MAASTSMSALAEERGRTFSVEEPTSWELLAKYAAEGSEESLGKLGRSKEQSAHYRLSKEKLMTEYASILDTVKIDCMGFVHAADNEGRKMAIRPGSKQTALVPNGFPYNFAAGVKHFVLWSTRPLSSNEVDDLLTEHRKDWETILFKNPPSLCSIPDLWHIHVASRKRI